MPIVMEYGAIQGDATDANYQYWLDVTEINFDGVHRRIGAPSSTRGGRESATCEFGEVVLIRHMDKASPQLFLEACQGRGKELIVHLTKTTSAGRGADTYLEYRFSHALISGYQVLASRHSRYRPVEHLTVSFTGLEIRYIPYDEDGNALAPMAVGYDPATHTRI